MLCRQAMLHLERTLSMVRSYRCTACPQLYGKAALLTATQAALHYWVTTNPKNTNWWWNDIGMPEYVCTTSKKKGGRKTAA